MKEFLRKAGYKATPGRLAVLELLRESKKPLSIPEIVRGARGSGKGIGSGDRSGKKIDQVTAYRILDVLEKTGLVRKVDLRHGHADYEFAAADDHHHLICLKCGLIEDFEGCDLNSLARKALRSSKNFAKITQHSLEFFGLCKKCICYIQLPSATPSV